MATRLYGVATTLAPVSPAFDSGWLLTTGALRRTLSTSKAATTETVAAQTIGAVANSNALAFQLVSAPLAAQTITGGTVTVIMRGRELVTTDNVNKRWRKVYVVSNDGSTIRGTLVTMAASGSTTELGTTLSGTVMAVNAGTGTLAVSDGDRIVVEVGYGLSATGTTPQSDMVIGGNGTDHTTTEADTTGTVPWVEFSQTLTFLTYSGPTLGAVGTYLAGVSSASAAVPVPAGVVSGSVVEVTLYKENTATVTPPAGGAWTLKNTAQATDHQQQVWWKRATASDSGTYSFTWTGSVWREAVAIRIDGCAASGDPYDTNTDSEVNNTAGTTAPAASAVLSSNVLAVWHGTSFAGGAWSSPTGFTENVDNSSDMSVATEQIAFGATVNATGATCAGSGRMTAYLSAFTAATGAATQNGAADLTAASSLTSAGVVTELGTANLTASASLVSSASVTGFGAAGLTASSSLVVAGIVTRLGTVALTAGSSLSAAGVVSKIASAPLAASSNLSAAGTVTGSSAAASLTATAALTVVGVVTELGSVNLSASAQLTVSGFVTELGSANLSASAQLVVAGVVTKQGAADLAAVATLTAAATRTVLGSAPLVASSTLTASGSVAGQTAADLVATAALVVSGQRTAIASASLTAGSAFTASGLRIAVSAAALSASSSLSVSGVVTLLGVVTLTAAATLIVSGTVVGQTGADLVAGSALSTTGQVARVGAAPLLAVATLAAAGVVSRPGVVALLAVASLAAVGRLDARGSAALHATAALSASSFPISNGSAALIAISLLGTAGTTHTPGYIGKASVRTRPASDADATIRQITETAYVARMFSSASVTVRRGAS